MRPGITAALITKNEARCLERCLASMRDWVEEIVVVDTGSTDETIAIARKFDARIQQIEWPDDFAIARNASLDMVETEWTLWMDADEWFLPGVEKAIKEAIGREDAFAWEFIRRDITPDGSFAEAPLVRLWRSHPHLRMTGIIHEHIDFGIATGIWPDRKAFSTNVFFLHDGYNGPQSSDKLRRNLPLLRRELDERPGQLYYEIELASTLKDLKEPEGDVLWEDLIERILELSHLDEPPSNHLGPALIRILHSLEPHELKSERTDQLIRITRGWFWDLPGALSTIGQTEIKRGNLRGAFDALMELDRLSRSKSLRRDVSERPETMTLALWTNLALVAHQIGRKDVARENYLKLLSVDPNNAMARENLKALG